MPNSTNPPLNAFQKVLLEAKLRRCSSDAFQAFFSEVMSEVHGSDFIKVRAYGSLGDRGCDGYLLDSGKLYQCYGALNGNDRKVKTLIDKMNKDFLTALGSEIGKIMKEWYMVHNLVEGLPTDAIVAMNKLKEQNPDIKCGFVGFEGFEQRIAGLHPTKIENLIGAAATNEDSLELQLPELSQLVDAIIELTESEGAISGLELDPVSVDKLDHNALATHWKMLISSGWNNAYIVSDYLDHHPDPLAGETIATHLNTRYLYLKSQGISSDAIMTSLYEFVTGKGHSTVQRQVAAHALLAHLFESCDIFENAPLRA